MILKIVICDDFPLIRLALRCLIELSPDMRVEAEYASLKELREGLTTVRPDLAIYDLSMEDSDGPESIGKLIDSHPWLKILVVSCQSESVYAIRCLRAGAKGFVMKMESKETLFAAMRKVLQGGIWANGNANPRVAGKERSEEIAPGSDLDGLTNRELQIFNLIGQGHPVRYISTYLAISCKTVETHCANLKRKLNQDSASQLLRYASIHCDKNSCSFSTSRLINL